ncbi:alpha/beta hydrolase [Tateyamaria armeniaca]|uniref:Alpha/beta hydrolase n=1 Tax=Tateyamaria armeniaca TaxID=2518930 RepID=A0ABW8UVT9_9RHOB
MRILTLALTGLLAALPGAASRAETVVIPGAPDAIIRVVSRVAGPDPALIVGLHGYGAHETQIATLLPVDTAVPHIYVALRAPLILAEGGYAWFPIHSGVSGINIAPVVVERAVNELARLLPRMRLRSECPQKTFTFPVTPKAEHSHSRLLCSGRTPLRVLVAHGARDPLISKGEIATTRNALSSHGRAVTAFDEDVPHVVGNAGRLRLQRWLASTITRQH